MEGDCGWGRRRGWGVGGWVWWFLGALTGGEAAVCVSRGRGDCGDDNGGDCSCAAGDAGVATAAESSARCLWLVRIYLWKRGHLKVAATVLVNEIDYGTFVAIEEADKLAEIRRSDVVKDGVEVAVIGYVERIDPEPDVMDLATPVSKQRQAELAVEFHVQRKIFREALSVGRAHILLLNINRRIREAGVNVDERAERELPRQGEDSPANDAIRNV